MQILFVCTGNTCRSPMAAFLARNLVQERGLPWTVESAGLYAVEGHSMTGAAADALTRRGIPLQPHRSQPVTGALVEQSDVILAMTAGHAADLQRRFPEAQGKVYVLGQFLAVGTESDSVYDIVDPFGGSDREYEDCAQAISRAVTRLISHLAGKERDE